MSEGPPWLPPLVISGVLGDARDCGDEMIYPPGSAGVGESEHRDCGDEMTCPGGAGVGGDTRDFGDTRVDP